MEELQNRFEKLFSNTKLPDVVRVRPECIQKDLIDIINPMTTWTELDPIIKHILEIFEAVSRIDQYV